MFMNMQVFVGTTVGSNPFMTENPRPPPQLLVKVITWWGYFTQIDTPGIGSDPSLVHGKEISVIVRNKLCNGRVFVMY